MIKGQVYGGASARTSHHPTTTQTLPDPRDIVRLLKSQQQLLIHEDTIQINLILVRHGYSRANENSRLVEPIMISDPRLVKEYADSQPQWAGKLIKSDCLMSDYPTIIVSSNMIRAMMTASFLSKEIDPELSVFVSPHLKEHQNQGQKKGKLDGGNTTLQSPDYQLHKILKEYPDFNQMFLFDKEFFRFIHDKAMVIKQIKKKKQITSSKRTMASGMGGAAAGGLFGGLPGAAIGALVMPWMTKKVKSSIFDEGVPYQQNLKDVHESEFIKDYPENDFIPIHFKKDAARWPSLLYKDDMTKEDGELDTFFTDAVCRLLFHNRIIIETKRCNLIIVCHGGVIRQFLHHYKFVQEKHFHVGNCDVFHIRGTQIQCRQKTSLRLGHVCDWYHNPFQETPARLTPQYEQDQQFQIIHPPSSRHTDPSQQQRLKQQIFSRLRSNLTHILQQSSKDSFLRHVEIFSAKQFIHLHSFIQYLTIQEEIPKKEKEFILGVIVKFMEENHHFTGYVSITAIIHKLYECGYTYRMIHNFFQKYNLFDVFEHRKIIKMSDDEKRKIKQFVLPHRSQQTTTDRLSSDEIIALFTYVFIKFPQEKLCRILHKERSRRFNTLLYTLFQSFD